VTETGEVFARALERYVRSRSPRARQDAAFARDSRLFGPGGYLRSVELARLIWFVEGRLGRRLPSEQLTIQNFATIDTIVRRFGHSTPEAGAAAPVFRHEGAAAPDAGIDARLADAGLVRIADGGALLRGAALTAYVAVDAIVAGWVASLGAEEARTPPLIDAATLTRAGYDTAFPHLLLWASRTGRRRDRTPALTPAACYHEYARVAGGDAGPLRVSTVAGPCFRDEADGTLRRLRAFTMREIILIGRPADVDGALAGLTAELCRLATALDLRCALEPASDPFFRGPDSAEALSQRAGYTKLELQVDLADAPPLAVASINRHADHFGARFAIRSGDDIAHSACVAFGLERWAYVLLAYHGLDGQRWPEVVRG
jgi:hypothetical protein